MKKMFITEMNKIKTYVKPEMKVIEVDVKCLQPGSDPTYGVGGDNPTGNTGFEDLPPLEGDNNVKRWHLEW